MKSFSLILLLAFCALSATTMWALSVGQFSIPIADVASLIFAKLFAPNAVAAIAVPNADVVLFDIRGPRILAALMVGAALAAAGAAYQNLFRNPLVSPDILGVSSGAALGAVLGIFLSLPILVTQGFAFMGGLLAVALIFLIGKKIRGHDPILALVLIGVVVGSLLGSGLALIKYLADPTNQLPAITYWLLGSFSSVTRQDAGWAALILVISLSPLYLLRWRINLLALPDDEARALGLNVARTRLIVIIAATLMTATTVAVCGIIGWVGLLVPHAVRLVVGAEFSRLLPIAMMVGATFMLVVDTLGRTVAPIEIPPGVLTAVIGAPIFIALLASTFNDKFEAKN